MEQYERSVVDLNTKIQQLGPKYRLATDPSIVSTEVEDQIWQSLVGNDPSARYYEEMFRIRAVWLCQANNARAKAEKELKRFRLEWEVEKQRLASKIAQAEANLARSSTRIADSANCTLPCASASSTVIISEDENDLYIPKV
ncbi:hypothetical protein H632_c250p1 [Helicosporidium sp. ATCC 50920]|nr:hypothetical protein H632_c250p1 [Helicosporidium sp. ATCC 50920]|eukprot:KDD76373.1 hypothetical protein H632_c250p1 [Helicosporidium sp. ATCC 50920]